MNCPSCKSESIQSTQLDNTLNAHQCKSCEGHWILSDDYLGWIDRLRTNQAESSTAVCEDATVKVEAGQQAKICPDCGHILVRFKVGRGLDFFIEQCHTCNGMWLDKNKWQVLKKNNLHKEIHLVFSDHWQNQIRADETKKNLVEIYLNMFGEKDYAELKRIKTWIDPHPKRDALLAYLEKKDPYTHGP